MEWEWKCGETILLKRESTHQIDSNRFDSCREPAQGQRDDGHDRACSTFLFIIQININIYKNVCKYCVYIICICTNIQKRITKIFYFCGL